MDDPLNDIANDIPQRAMGCLPRTTAVGERWRTFRTQTPTIPESQWHKYITTVRPQVWSIQDQGEVGSCASEASVQALKIMRAIQGQSSIELNPLSLYRQVNVGTDNGSGIDENLDLLSKVGVLPEAMWPRAKGWRSRPPIGWEQVASQYRALEWWDIASREEFGTALCLGFPVVYGVHWSGGGGHAICGVALHKDGVQFANSWGSDWGDSGFDVMGWPQVERGVLTYGAWCLRSVVISGPAPESMV